MPRKSVTILLICSACVLFLALYAAGLTAVEADNSLQTWPSRTPTPRPGQTQPPGGSTPGGSSPATATAESTSSASTPAGNLTIVAGSPLPPTVVQPPAVTIFSTVPPESESNIPTEGGLTPVSSGQVAGCEIPPFIEALGTVSVRTGVGIDQETIGNLLDGDRRTILARADQEPWWLIQFDSEAAGWVSDQAVLVHGYTGYVPVNNLGDSKLAPAIAWNPTPNPACTPPAPENVADADSGSTSILETGELEVAHSTANDQPNMTEQGSEPPNDPTETQNSPEFDDQQAEPQSSNSTLIWLLITGVFLIVVGATTLFIRRRNY